MILVLFAVLVMAAGLENRTLAAGVAVTNLMQVGSSENSVKISYDKPLRARKFEIYISEDNTFPANATVTKKTTSCKNVSVSGLNPNCTYYVKVIPIFSTDMEYDFSDAITCVTEPKEVEDLKHTDSTVSSVTVAWKEPLIGAQCYNVYYKPMVSSIEPIYVGATSNRTYTIKNLSDDEENRVYVYPVRKSEEGYEVEGNVEYKSSIPTVANPNKFTTIKLYKWQTGSNTATIRYNSDAEKQSGIEIEVFNLSGNRIKTVQLKDYVSSGKITSNRIKNRGFQYRMRYYVTTDTKKCYGPYTKMKIAIPYANKSKKN